MSNSHLYHSHVLRTCARLLIRDALAVSQQLPVT